MSHSTNILVIGGAGYIGSYMCKHLARSGYTPVVLDNLSRGYRKAVRWGPFVEGDLNDASLVARVLEAHDIAAVMHFAAFINVGESVEDPVLYYQNNVASTIGLLQTMKECGVKHFIFSSSAAVYGEPAESPIPETHPCAPVNPYGWSKLMVERILADFERAYGLRSTSLRYFNAAGADPEADLGEDHRPETHLVPLVLKTALGSIPEIAIFGDDYPTPDGTCLRDYVHIHDLVEAHLLALQRLLDDKPGGIYNLGNGTGYSVRQVIETARRVTGRAIPQRSEARRPGDAAVLVASSGKARHELGWQPRYGALEEIIETAWAWHRKHPEGYGDEG